MDWDALPPGARAALEQQWIGVGAGAVACGAAIVDSTGDIVAVRRNHAYDPITGMDPLEGTPIAHAVLGVAADGALGEAARRGSSLPDALTTLPAGWPRP